MREKDREREREQERVSVRGNGFEREREHQWKRRDEDEWTVVRRKHAATRSNKPIANKTIFVDFLPPDIQPHHILNIFSMYGDIANLVLPTKLRPRCNHKYAFVKYFSTQAFLNAIRKENGRKMGSFQLRVNPAKYDKHEVVTRKPITKPNPPYRNPNNIPVAYYPSYRNHRSYKDATQQPTKIPVDNHPRNPSQVNPPTSIIPNQILEPNPSNLVQEMSKKRIMSSRVLGETTENTRRQLNIGELDGDQYLWIKGNSNPDLVEVLGRSVVGVANSPSMVILDHMLAEGVRSVKIQPLGGLLHLLTFESVEDKQAMIESQWLQRWFLELRDVNNSSAAIWREVWLTIYGVPITAWSYDSFLDIGSIYGKVLSVDYSRMDYARVLVITDCFFMINNPILFTVEDKNFKVYITEESSIPVTNQPLKSNVLTKNPAPENVEGNLGSSS